MGEIAQLAQRVFEAVPEYVQPSHNLRILLGQLTRECELDAQAGQVLLCAVVQVALDLAALEISRGDRVSTRRGKLGGRRLKLGRQATVLDRQQQSPDPLQRRARGRCPKPRRA